VNAVQFCHIIIFQTIQLDSNSRIDFPHADVNEKEEFSHAAINAQRLLVYKYLPLSIVRYSFIQLSKSEQLRMNEMATVRHDSIENLMPQSLNSVLQSKRMLMAMCSIWSMAKITAMA